jgi:hypothetical protein
MSACIKKEIYFKERGKPRQGAGYVCIVWMDICMVAGVVG